MDEAPVFEAEVEARVVPRGAIRVPVVMKGARYFPLVREFTEGGGFGFAATVVEEATGFSCTDRVGVLWVRNCWWTRGRGVNGDVESLGGAACPCPEGPRSVA